MKKRFFKLVLVIISAFLFIQNSNAQSKEIKHENSLLWKVSGNELEKPSYLFGTLHAVCTDSLVLREEVKEAIAVSDRIITEISLDKIEGVQEFMTANSVAEDSLSKGLSAQEKRKLEQDLQKLGFQLDQVEMVQPFLLNIMLLEHAKPTCELTSVENVVLAEAKINNLKKGSLETIHQQLEMMKSVMDKKTFLIGIDALLERPKMLEELTQIYLNEDIQGIYTIMFEDSSITEQFLQEMLIDRNVDWVNQIADMPKHEAAFIAIGAGHLVGPKGLIFLLRAKGYLVEAVMEE